MKSNTPLDRFYNSTADIKIQPRSKRIKQLVVIICASVGGAIALLNLLWAWIKYKTQNRVEQKEEDDDDRHIDWSAGLPLLFSFQELQDATDSFSIKLGIEGFGSNYEGDLSDGSKIAVKQQAP